jgi:hypothetical protein
LEKLPEFMGFGTPETLTILITVLSPLPVLDLTQQPTLLTQEGEHLIRAANLELVQPRLVALRVCSNFLF